MYYQMPIRKSFILFLLILIFSFVSNDSKAQDTIPANDSIAVISDSFAISDTTHVATTDSVPQKDNGIDAPVYYESKDSIVMTGTNMMYLFGNGNVKYKNLDLTAEYIEVNTDSSLAYATFALDTLGNEFGYPIFKEGETSYEMKTMRYNFKTKKGFITDVITQQGEGYVTAGRTKKMDNDDLFMVDGKYTTCDEHDHPHFYLKLSRAKVKPGKNIVTGPAYLVVEDVPLPIAVPFAFFPFTSSYSSGVIMPTYVDELSRGFGLRDGGYYFALSDYVDLAVTGEIYTKGSWGLNARSTYKKRYKFSGNFDIGYLVTVNGDKDSPDYYTSKDFKIKINHTQDAKANPFTRISASVDFTSSSYDRNELNSVYGSRYSDNQKMSTVNVAKSFSNTPLTINASMRISQRTKDSTVSVSLPDMSLSYPQTYPFRRKNASGKERWYEAIYLSYTGSIRNSITTKDSALFKSNFVKDWTNGMQHNIPVSASFNILKYINISPSFNYTERWYTNKIDQEYDYERKMLAPSDTTYGFYRAYNYNMSVSVNTKLYGFYKPWKIFGDKVEAIRHVLTPSVSFSGAPDFSDPRFGSWESTRALVTNSQGFVVDSTLYYSPFQYGIFGAPSKGKTGTISFGLQNNVEMKIKSDSDSTGVKKISLIDNLSLGMSYNFLAEQYPWSDLSASMRLKLSKSYTLNLNATFDTYAYDSDGIRTRPRWEVGKGIGRLKTTGTSFSYSFNNESLKKLFKKGDSDSDKKDSKTPEGTDEDEEATGETQYTPLRGAKKEIGEFDSDGYMITNIPWNLSFNYTINLSYGDFNKAKKEYDYRITQNLGFNGDISPTKGWRFNFNTSYDFDAKKFAMVRCGVTRDLHCWSMSANFVPVGPYQSYMFTVSVKSSLLQDLKYNQSSNSRDAVKWE